MPTVDENYQDLWSGLESEFEQKEAEPLGLELPSPPSRQRTVDVANLQNVFSGFYPVAVMCLAGAMLGLGKTFSETLPLGVTCLLALVLAKLLEPALRGPRRRWWYYSLTALLVGGTAELLVILSQSILDVGTGHHLDSYDLARYLQRQIESFYSVDHWLIYIVLGAAVGYATYRSRARAPWMDSPSTGLFRGAVLTGLLALPFLLPLGCFILGTVNGSETGWFRAVSHSNPDLFVYRRAYSTERSQAFEEIRMGWLDSVPAEQRKTDFYGRIPQHVLETGEQKYLDVCETHEMRPGLYADGSFTNEVFLARRSDLREPFRVASTMVRESMVEHHFGGHDPDLPAQWDFLLDTLTSQAMNPNEAETLLKEFEAYDRDYLSPVREADRWVLGSILHRPVPQPLHLFGLPLAHSPERLHFLYSVRPVTRRWFELKDTLPWDEPDRQLALIKEHEKDGEGILGWLASKTYDHELRPLWRGAAVLVAARVYRTEHGQWPDSFAQLEDLLWFPASDQRSLYPGPIPDYQFSQTTEGFQIQDNSSNRSWVLR